MGRHHRTDLENMFDIFLGDPMIWNRQVRWLFTNKKDVTPHQMLVLPFGDNTHSWQAGHWAIVFTTLPDTNGAPTAGNAWDCLQQTHQNTGGCSKELTLDPEILNFGSENTPKSHASSSLPPWKFINFEVFSYLDPKFIKFVSTWRCHGQLTRSLFRCDILWCVTRVVNRVWENPLGGSKIDFVKFPCRNSCWNSNYISWSRIPMFAAKLLCFNVLHGLLMKYTWIAQAHG